MPTITLHFYSQCSFLLTLFFFLFPPPPLTISLPFYSHSSFVSLSLFFFLFPPPLTISLHFYSHCSFLYLFLYSSYFLLLFPFPFTFISSVQLSLSLSLWLLPTSPSKYFVFFSLFILLSSSFFQSFNFRFLCLPPPFLIFSSSFSPSPLLTSLFCLVLFVQNKNVFSLLSRFAYYNCSHSASSCKIYISKSVLSQHQFYLLYLNVLVFSFLLLLQTSPSLLIFIKNHHYYDYRQFSTVFSIDSNFSHHYYYYRKISKQCRFVFARLSQSAFSIEYLLF